MNIFGKMLTPSRILVVGFALVILFGTLLLTLPQATQDGLGLPFYLRQETNIHTLLRLPKQKVMSKSLQFLRQLPTMKKNMQNYGLRLLVNLEIQRPICFMLPKAKTMSGQTCTKALLGTQIKKALLVLQHSSEWLQKLRKPTRNGIARSLTI